MGTRQPPQCEASDASKLSKSRSRTKDQGHKVQVKDQDHKVQVKDQDQKGLLKVQGKEVNFERTAKDQALD